MKLKLGPPVTGDNFFKRPALIATLLRAIRRGNVAFLGPRRTGKTSCLEEIRAHPDRFTPILLNLEQHDSVEGWLVAMRDGARMALGHTEPGNGRLQTKARAFLDRLHKITVPGVGSIELATSGQPPRWKAPAADFLAALATADLPLLFLIDEFPTFLDLVARRTSRDEVESVLGWFRAARHDLKSTDVRFLVTGSIGLKGVVRRLGLAPTVNEFDTLEIPPLSDDEAERLLAALALNEDIPLDAEGRARMLELLGGNWPFLLQLFLAELQDAALGRPPTTTELERIYRERLVHGNRNQYCEGMYSRLTSVFSDSEAQLAREILRTVCRDDRGLGRPQFEAIHARFVPEPGLRAAHADELDHVLDTLKHDGYLVQETEGDERTRFATHMLRDYWRRKTA